MVALKVSPLIALELNELRASLNAIIHLTRVLQSNDEHHLGSDFPSVDIYEDCEGFVVEVELPGVDPKEISLTFQNNLLTIQGKRERFRTDTPSKFHLMERFTGAFSRVVSFTEPVNGQDISAKVENGVLAVRLAHLKERRGKSLAIPIQYGKSPQSVRIADPEPRKTP